MELQTINPEKFGNLIDLPNILNANKTSTANATKAANAVLATIQNADLTKMELAVIESSDKQLNDLYVKLKTTEAAQKAKREPYTQFFDELRGLFTTEEKAVVTLQESVKLIRNNIAREKIRRENERQASLQKDIDKKNEAIEIRTIFRNALFNQMINSKQNIITKMNDAFNAQTIETFGEWQSKMEKYDPGVWKFNTISAPVVLHHSHEEIFKIYNDATSNTDGYIQDLNAQHANPIIAEKNRLVELIPSRKAELERIANDATAKIEADKRIEEEKQKRETDAAAAITNQQQQTAATAENEKLTGLFDAHATAAPVVELAKGTTVKKKYTATTHAAFAALLQSWVKNDMAGMSVADLEKKLGFIITAANKRLNSGEKIEAVGLLVEDDITTRGSKTKAE